MINFNRIEPGTLNYIAIFCNIFGGADNRRGMHRGARVGLPGSGPGMNLGDLK